MGQVKSRIGQVGTGQARNGQIGTGQFRTGQVGTGQVGTSQVRTVQVGIGHVGTGQVSNTSSWDSSGRDRSSQDRLRREIILKHYFETISAILQTWNSSVALLSPTCIIYYADAELRVGICIRLTFGMLS